MAKNDAPAPIVIKRIKKGGHAHHGGAWKIAYADFVTAMMAFFLLMWLLGSTSQGDLKGLAEFFNDPVRFGLGGGSGSGDSSHVIKGGGQSITRSWGQVEKSAAKAPKANRTLNFTQDQAGGNPKDELEKAEAQLMMAVKDKLENMFQAEEALRDLKDHLRVDLTPNGLRIMIIDSQNRPMFDGGSPSMREHSRTILREIAKVIKDLPQHVSVTGHTDAKPYPGSERGGYGNWELSADRANSARRELVGGGLGDEKLLKVTGVGSSQPYNQANPDDPMNRRITLMVLNSSATRAVREESGSMESEAAAAAPPATAPASR